MGKHFPVRKKSGNFEQTGKIKDITQSTEKVWEFQTNVIYYFSDILMNCVLFAKQLKKKQQQNI